MVSYIPDKRLIVANAGAMTCLGLSVGLVSVMYPEMADSFELSLAGRGLISSTLFGAILVSILVAGPLADRFGKRALMAGGGLLLAAGLLLQGFAGSYRMLLAGAVVAGLGAGAYETLVNPLIVRMYPGDSSGRLNVFHACFNVGLLAGALVKTAMGAYAAQGWQWGFRGASILAVAVGLLFAMGRYPPEIPHHESVAAAKASLLRWAFWLLAAVMFLTTAVEIGVTSWVTNFLQMELGASVSDSAQGLSAYTIAMLLARLFMFKLFKHVRPVVVLLVSALAGAVLIWLAAGSESIPFTLVVFALAGVCQAGFWPTTVAYASRRLDDTSSTMMGLLCAAGMLGCVVAPWLIGALGDATASLRAGLVVLTVPFIVSAAIYAGFLATSRPSAPH